jgi:hypothetical protein
MSDHLKQKHLLVGLKVENGKLDIQDVIDRLTAMKPNIELDDFDHAKSSDKYYCIEWGMKKAQWQEGLVIERYINELTELYFNELKELQKD